MRNLELGGVVADDLERLVINALKLRRNWTSPSPEPKVTLAFDVARQCRVIRLHFLKSHLGRPWLLSLALEPGPQRRVWMQLWDVSTQHPTPIAQEEVTLINSVVINENPDAVDAIAIHTSSV